MSKRLSHVMLDIETLSCNYNCVVVSVGAVQFDFICDRIDTFECVFDDLSDQLNRGREKDNRTMSWWANLPEAASDVLFAPNKFKHILMNTKTGLTKLNEFIENRYVWGNGSTFDNVIIRDIMRDYTVNPKWPYFKDLCFRTLKKMFPINPIDRAGTHHNALDDALYQVMWLKEIVRRYKLKLLDGV